MWTTLVKLHVKLNSFSLRNVTLAVVFKLTVITVIVFMLKTFSNHHFMVSHPSSISLARHCTGPPLSEHWSSESLMFSFWTSSKLPSIIAQGKVSVAVTSETMRGALSVGEYTI